MAIEHRRAVLFEINSAMLNCDKALEGISSLGLDSVAAKVRLARAELERARDAILSRGTIPSHDD